MISDRLVKKIAKHYVSSLLLNIQFDSELLSEDELAILMQAVHDIGLKISKEEVLGELDAIISKHLKLTNHDNRR